MGGVFADLWLGLIVLLFGSYAELAPLAVIGGMLTVIGVELIMRVPSAQLIFRTGEWGPIAAMAITFLTALFILLQYTIFLGVALSLILYVVASSKKFQLQQIVRMKDGNWETSEAPKTLASGQATVIVVQGLDFLPRRRRWMTSCPPHAAPRVRSQSSFCAICITIPSTAIRWLERYAKSLKAEGGLLILTDVNAEVMERLKKRGALEAIGAEHIIPATTRVLGAENEA